MTDPKPVAEQVRDTASIEALCALSDDRTRYAADHRFVELAAVTRALLTERDALQTDVTSLKAQLTAVRGNYDTLRSHLQTIGDIVSGEARLTDPHDIVSEVAQVYGERDTLRQRLAEVTMYCDDQTDGDCQPHDTILWRINRLAKGKRP